ncbi:MAG TPA: N-6 DNA methylase [Thermoanaerobaculia bacterium]|nr:N-6 DNA methylase [Thermoanaerobaculia bacterium]
MSRVAAVSGVLRSEGALLPPSFLARLAARDSTLQGLTPESYHLLPGERLAEAGSRAWNRLVEVWSAFGRAADNLAPGDAGTALTRERWLLPLLSELGYGRLAAARALEIDGKSYPISHAWQGVPIHLVGWNVLLDHRTPGVAGAARTPPHSLVQELLNRSEAHLWGVVSNGRKLRLLRDSRALARQAFVEVDLEAIFAGSSYADFLLLFLLLHQSRLEGPPGDCWLERWAGEARRASTRALDRLRSGVERAVEALGEGALAHPANGRLRDGLASGELPKHDLYRQLLRAVYRLIFLFVAEERGLLAPPGAELTARERYLDHYSGRRLREIAGRQRGTPHADLWQALRLVFAKLDHGCPELALPAFGSFLWNPRATPDLDGAELANSHLLEAVRALAYTEEGAVRRAVDWRNLGPEELGSVYESLLELHPDIDAAAGRFRLASVAGHERKVTGSYYTPTSLIECLLDSALDPVIERAARERDPVASLLNLKVCDPACGSGHFLLAAAHRIARRLAAARSGEEEPPPEALRHALRDVISHCLYGVDVNPMAVELCKVSLWLEALDPGRPLSFLDHHIQCGHSLLGTTPALLARGIPEAAFDPVTGDDKAWAKKWKAIHRQERKARAAGQESFDYRAPWQRLGDLATAMHQLDDLPDDTPEAVAEKQRRWEELVRSSDYLFGHLLADAWCAAFLWRRAESPELPYPITEDTFRKLERNPHQVPGWLRAEVRRLAEEHRFFHWHLAFPEVFRAKSEPGAEDPLGWEGGFDCVVGNPPWEQAQTSEQEFFADRAPEIAKAAGDERKTMIAELESGDLALFRSFREEVSQTGAMNLFVRESGRFPLCARGKINSYSLFAELMRQTISPRGRVGCIVPLGIATDDTTKDFFRDLSDSRSLVSLYGFENEERVFPGVHHALRFCLLTLSGRGAPVRSPEFAFSLRQVTSLQDEERRFTLSAEDIALLNPNTRTCPIFRTRRDANITKGIYIRVPVLVNESLIESSRGWTVTFRQGLFNMTTDSGLFRSRAILEAEGWQLRGNIYEREDVRYLPLYEGKMVHHFDHRFGTYEGQTKAQARQGKLLEATEEHHSRPEWAVLPSYWVTESAVAERLASRWERDWLLGWRDITGTEKIRTAIATVIPRTACGHTVLLMFPQVPVPLVAALLGCLDSFVLDFVARQKVGGTHLTYHIFKQLAIPEPSRLMEGCAWARANHLDWLRPRVLELTYTAWDLQGFARDLGWEGPPFRWDEERRFLLRAELDAAFFHLYGINRDDADHILDTFPVVKKNDEKRFGTYRTKHQILDLYDRLAHAIASGQPYETVLDPPPADPRVLHGAKPNEQRFVGATQREP